LLLGGTGLSVTAFFYGTFHHDARQVAFLDTLAPIFARLLRGFWWWTLFLILPFLWVFRRGPAHKDTQEHGFVFLAFLFAGLANDLLFNQWAQDHSFWSYYLIPAACVGSAITLQWLHEVRFRFWATAIAFRVAVPALFVMGALSSRQHMMAFIRPHFHPPVTIPDMLSDRGLQDMLDRDSVLLVPPYCRGPLSPSSDMAGDAETAPRCDIYFGFGSLARYAFDRSAIPTADFDPSKTRCDQAFAVVKGPGMAARLAQLSMTATEVPWFDWHVLRLSQLAPGYCENPARIFADLSRTPVKASRPGN
jgi:hypothetical protein